MRKRLRYNLQYFASDTAAGTTDADNAANAAPDAMAADADTQGETTTAADTTEPSKKAEEEADKAATETDIAQLVAEEVKKASMTSSERAEYEAQQREQALITREAAITLRELTAEAKVVLADNGLPDTFLSMVLGKDKEDTEARIKALKANFDTAVQAQVVSRLKGTTPSTGTGVTGMTAADTLAAQIDSYL